MKLPSDIQKNGITSDAQKPREGTFIRLIKIAGLIGGLSLIGWFIIKSDPQVIWEQLCRININFIFIIGVTFSAYFIVSIAWKLSFTNSPSHISIFQLFIIRLIGESLAQINPTNLIAGETLKAVILKRKGVDYTDSVVSLTISRFLIILSFIFMMVIGVVLFFDYLKVFGNKTYIIVILTGICCILGLIVYLLHSGKGIFSGFIGLIEKKFKINASIAKTFKNLTEIDREIITFYQTKKLHFLTAFTLSFLHRVVGAMEFYVILYFLGFDVTPLACITMDIGVTVFKTLGAFVPGQIGFEEYGNKMMLDFVNIPGGEIWITVSILKRARQLFWIGCGVISFYFVMRTKKKHITIPEELKNGSSIYYA